VVALTAFVLVLATSAAQCQAGRRQGGQQRQARAVPLITVPLETLNTIAPMVAEQKEKLKAIYEQYENEARPLRPQRGAQQTPENRQKLAEINRKYSEQVEQVLTPEQRTKITDALRQFGALRGLGIPLDVATKLNLTEAQKKQIEPLVREATEKVRAMSPDERRAKSREVMAETREKVLQILTEDQKKMLQEARRGNRNRQRQQP
jgi:Spy/CpxP family protein refolding chaperone